jgi:topoisomerase-4 subunit A
VYWDGESKQHFVKRFQVETNSLDKEFGFISEGIGSRLEFVTTADTPELEIEVVKGKGKDKETELVNLEEIIDVKGWKAMGNRLSPYKVTKVRPEEEPEDAGLEEADDEGDPTMTETGKGSQSSKKKLEGEQKVESSKQESLFGEAAASPPPKKQKAEQGSLFGESQKEKREGKPVANEQVARDLLTADKRRVKTGTGKETMSTSSKGGKAFGVGETIELEL